MALSSIKIELRVNDSFTFPMLMACRKTLRLTLKLKGFIKQETYGCGTKQRLSYGDAVQRYNELPEWL